MGTYIFSDIMFEYSFRCIQIGVLLSFRHGPYEVWYEIVRLHFIKIDFSTGHHADLGCTVVGCIFIYSMLCKPTEFILWQVSEHTRECMPLQSTDAWNSRLIALYETL